MKQLLIAFISFLIVNSVTAQKIINDPNAEIRKASDFHALKISGGFTVILTQSNEESLAVSANQKEFMEHIRTEVDKGVLKIWYEEKNKFWPKNKKLKAYISVKNLENIQLDGASDIKIEGQLTTDELNLHLSGASDLKGAVVVKGKFEIKLNGASDINITGSANNTSIDASGASDVKAYDFTTSFCDVDASGACSVHISVDKELSARLSGASSVSYKGAAMIKEIKTSGASNISRKS